MANSIVITEKPSQARNVSAAVGTTYGQVLSAIGHLIDLEEPHDANPAWKSWNYDLLAPPRGRYKMKPVFKTMSHLRAIGAALKTATRVYIATDCDREGQLIGQEILEFHNFKGEVYRAMFTAEDPTTLKAAFASAQPNRNYQSLYDAAEARRQSDQIYNLTMTRVATLSLKDPSEKGAIGIGRVKTPTMAIVCRREEEIANFKPTDFHEIAADATASHPFSMRHAPQAKITDKVYADEIAKAATGHKGPIKVETQRKSVKPPRLLDLPALQTKCSSWGWTAKKVLEVAQALYETHKAATYPRAEARYLPEGMIADVPKIRAMLHAACSPDVEVCIAVPEVIRKGKDGSFSDKQLQGVSHHAIVPNVNCPNLKAAWGAMSADEKRMFALIARTYAASVLPDYIHDATSIKMDVPDPRAPATPREFSAHGSVPVSMGWKIAMGADADDEDDESGALPPVRDGEVATIVKAKVESKVTKPPPRYSEGALIKAMQEAWKFVEDDDERDRLKEAKGIGTPATRDSIIEGLKRQNLLIPQAKVLVPSQAAMELYRIIKAKAPALGDPGATARMEMTLDDVQFGKITGDAAIGAISAIAAGMIPVIQQAGQGAKLTTGRQLPPSAPPKRGSAKAAPRGGAGGPGARPAPRGQAAPQAAARPSYPAPTAAQVASRIYFLVDFAEKEKAKAHGLQWDGTARKWYAANPAIAAKAKADFKTA